MTKWKNVPVYSQKTLNLCWEACARMMWHWRHRDLQDYEKKAGEYAHLNVGLSHVEMDTFYQKLGLRSLRNPGGGNLVHALKWTPVIFTLTDKVSGHALVATDYTNQGYSAINPCGIEVVSFEDGADSCTGGKVNLAKDYIERNLGDYIWYW